MQRCADVHQDTDPHYLQQLFKKKTERERERERSDQQFCHKSNHYHSRYLSFQQHLSHMARNAPNKRISLTQTEDFGPKRKTMVILTGCV